MAENLPDAQGRILDGENHRAGHASPAPASDSPSLICGVERSIVESFLNLIRDNYKKADKATFFLEQRTGVVNVQGITNVRDVLSHLVTLLSPDTPDNKKLEQLGNAEEHLRRAIMEPYEIALNELTVRFAALYEKYKAQLLPVKDRYTDLENVPNDVSVEAILRNVRELTARGRMAKGKNLWDPEWESGVASFIEAFEKLSTLHSEIEAHFNKFEQHERDDARQKEIEALRKEIANQSQTLTEQSIELNAQSRRSARLNIWGIIATITTAILAIIVTILLSKK